MESARLAIGDRVARYIIVDVAGEGGMGVIYVGYDPDLDRRVALKLLHQEGSDGTPASDSTEARARLVREAQAMARLNHRNVVPIYDAGTYHDQVFLAMEYVAGGHLKQWLRERQRSIVEILRVFTEAGRGLAAAHDAGLVHRDF